MASMGSIITLLISFYDIGDRGGPGLLNNDIAYYTSTRLYLGLYYRPRS